MMKTICMIFKPKYENSFHTFRFYIIMILYYDNINKLEETIM